MRKRVSRCIGAVGLWCVACALAGCRTTPPSETPLLFFPSPPAVPRVQFLTWASGAEQVEPSTTSFEEFVLGEEIRNLSVIDKPYGVAVRDGVVYVCDTKGLSICRLDFKNQKYSIFGQRRLLKPINIVIDQLGFKFVADPNAKQVVVFDPNDKFVTAFDVPKPCHPVDVAVYGNELYVLDNDASCQIVVMDRGTGEVLRTFGGPGAAPGQFKIPGSLCIGPAGYLYVSDTHNWRIQKLTREGEVIWMKGTAGYFLGQFGRPRGIRVGPDGTIFVVDGGTQIVQMFNPDGETLMRFGAPGNTPGTLVLPATLAIDTSSIEYFKKYVHADFDVEYLMFVTSQYGAYLINVYAFGSFPEGYEFSESSFVKLPEISMDAGIRPVSEPQDGQALPGTEIPAEPDGSREQDDANKSGATGG